MMQGLTKRRPTAYAVPPILARLLGAPSVLPLPNDLGLLLRTADLTTHSDPLTIPSC